MKKLVFAVLVVLAVIIYGAFKNKEMSVTASNAGSVSASNGNSPSGSYKDGTYTGSPEDAFYGTIQVQATVSGGKLSNVQFLQAPNDRGTSIMINQQADPMLAQEAIQAQSPQVSIVSGATDSSQAFIQSLAAALSQAH